jgi:hypothetical protein
MLNRWAAKADPPERALLDARLGGWVAHFGYDPDRIGWRPSPAIPHPAPPQPATPGPATFHGTQPSAPHAPGPVASADTQPPDTHP